jgi:hypothetical protein
MKSDDLLLGVSGMMLELSAVYEHGAFAKVDRSVDCEI